MTDVSTLNTAAHQSRPRQRVPEIRLPGGDVLVPRKDFCGGLGFSERSGRKKWNFPTTYIAGIAYVQRNASLQIIADTVERPNQPAAVRPRYRTRKNKVR
jgi:hypothetical protein